MVHRFKKVSKYIFISDDLVHLTHNKAHCFFASVTLKAYELAGQEGNPPPPPRMRRKNGLAPRAGEAGGQVAKGDLASMTRNWDGNIS